MWRHIWKMQLMANIWEYRFEQYILAIMKCLCKNITLQAIWVKRAGYSLCSRTFKYNITVSMIPPKITQKLNSCIKCVSLKYQIFKSTFLESAHVLVLVNHILALSDWKYFQSCLGFYNSMYSNDSRWEAKKGAFNCWSPFLLLSSSRLSDIQNACLYITEITLASRKKILPFFPTNCKNRDT